MADKKPGATIPPTIRHEFHERSGRRWPLLLIHVIMAAVIAAAAVFIVRLVYRSSVHNATKNPVGQSQQNTKHPSRPAKSGSQATNSTNNTPTSLPNNGPGDIAGIFTATAVSAGGLHYALRKRQSHQG